MCDHRTGAETVADVDYAVIGCGTMGSMTMWQLSVLDPSARIVGIEQFGRVHMKGSYAGESRLFRLILKEGGHYVDLAHRARELWEELNDRSGRDVFLPTGALGVGPAGHASLEVMERVVAEHGLPHEFLGAEELRSRFPQLAVSEDDRGIVDPAGGAIRPEVAVAVAQQLALDAGAQLWDRTTVDSLGAALPGEAGTSVGSGEGGAAATREKVPEGVIDVHTSRGVLRARRVICTVGSWSAQLCPTLHPRLAGVFRVRGIPLHWYMPLDVQQFAPGALPVFIKDFRREDGSLAHVFGAPSLDGWSVKVSQTELPQEFDDPLEALAWTTGSLDNSPGTDVEEAAAADAVAALPQMLPSVVRSTMHHDCFTPHSAPLLDIVDCPDVGNVVIGAGFSGRGMKFAPIYGRMLAQLAVTGKSELQIPQFTLATHAPT